mmetsp:Transcript_58767/g.110092  ORF Transcript_58767/g.110092 Transcript_58767/m.110092 type:complete len:140 (+) Transcript_58767:45-464(+)
MFRVKEIEAVLARAVTDSITNIMIIDEGGGVIAAAKPKQVENSGLAVISSALAEFKCAGEYISPDFVPRFEDALFTCDNALVACTTFLSSSENELAQIVLVVWSQSHQNPALLFSRLEVLKTELECLKPILQHSCGKPY